MARKLFKFFFAIGLFLILVIVLFKVIDVLNDFTLSRNMGIRNILQFALYIVPDIFVYTSPVALVCAVFYWHYTMFVDNELIIFQSSGISIWGLISPILFVTMIITVMSYMCLAFVIPYTKMKILDQRQIISRAMLPKIITAKTFISISDQISMYVNNKIGDKLEGLIIYDKRDLKEESVIIAKKAEVSIYKDSILFKMYGGSRQTVQDNALQMVFFDTLLLNVPFVGKAKSVRVSVDKLSFISLLKYKPVDKAQANEKKIEINKRISWPIVSVVFVFVAVSVLFSNSYNRFWNTSSLLTVFIVVAIYIFLYFFLKNGVLKSNIFIIAVYLNSILFTGFSIGYLNYKTKRLRHI